MTHWLPAAVLMTVGFGPMGPDAAREPQLAVSGFNVALVYGAGQTVYFSSSTDSGKTFAPPIKVGEGAVIPLNRHRGPRLAFATAAQIL